VEPLKTFNDLEPGDHISMKGDMFSKTKTRNVTKYLYTHHAIVNEVRETTDDGKGAIVQVYHVMPPAPEGDNNQCSKCVRKETKALDININNIKKISYNEPFYEKNEIKDRAEQFYSNGLIENEFIPDGYQVITNNCEHFCHFCSTRDWRSNQASRLSDGCRYVIESVFLSGPKFLRIFLKILILSTDDFMRNVYIAGGVLAFLLSVYLLLVLMLNNHCAFFFCYSTRECCCFRLSSNCCTDYPLCICLKCSCCHEYSSMNCSRRCRVSCCQLKKDEQWYCKICHNKTKCLRWYQFLVTLFCQGLGYALMVFMIYKNISNGTIIGVGVGISISTIILYILLPPCFLRICCCKKSPC
jgi:hypothetical protein